MLVRLFSDYNSGYPLFEKKQKKYGQMNIVQQKTPVSEESRKVTDPPFSLTEDSPATRVANTRTIVAQNTMVAISLF